jgi:hypothetical protein
MKRVPVILISFQGLSKVLFDTRCIPMDILAWTDCVQIKYGKLLRKQFLIYNKGFKSSSQRMLLRVPTLSLNKTL